MVKLKIGEYEVRVSAQHRFSTGEDTLKFLNRIALDMAAAADYHKQRGHAAIKEECWEMFDDIHAFLKGIGFYEEAEEAEFCKAIDK